ncbi:MAG: hypothetical protein A2V64_12730 [Bacteroidetes bacterium RBG_13_43_22]|nr:MAG: hypothetical protein A2V64_12730 [Bacteroidetes bacterium RBG_13_43_22]
MDIFPTIAEIVALPETCMIRPLDGISIKNLFIEDVKKRDKPILFRYLGKGALIDNNYKLVVQDISESKFELYDLKKDPVESVNILSKKRKIAKRMIQNFNDWISSVEASIGGKDYQTGLKETDPDPIYWRDVPDYQPYLEQWKNRPEYKEFLQKKY